MTPATRPRYAPDWLALREPADAAARAAALLAPLRRHLARQTGRRGPAGPQARRPAGRRAPASTAPEAAPLLIRDLGSGTGSLGRWLAPRLPGPQHWILHDHDTALLDRAAARKPAAAADGGPVTLTTEAGDLARLTAGDLHGTSLVTASALLDLLTLEEVEHLAASCAGARCPALLTLSVAGRVELTPEEPLDTVLTAAFNAHQRRADPEGRRLLGPDAVEAACTAFRRHGMTVRLHASPWRLGSGQAALAAEWLKGWTGAAADQRPDLAQRADAALRRRLDACAAGALRVVVHHHDLLALPRTAGDTP
ncbi:SAM-dependent methyltransferase [Streptomyces sp. JJ36]|uniref:SAM-dependent methyltransferase n=1 Tax=Streptomyces sp. JJ36 TaxID=2736645 RepID=UPI001F282521|nr:SAM-dependent methyltransferase [Streptomyces sp. JJ36]